MASPGDTLVIKDNYVYVNDERADDLITEYSGIAGVKINLKPNEYFVLGDNRKNSIATYQLSTASAWSIKYNKNPNFLIELADGNILKVEAIGSEATVKITCSNEKDEEIVLKATYTKTD